MKKIFIFLCLTFLILPAVGHTLPESYYQKQWCNRWNGKLEYELNDHCRVDCLTKNYAVEFDFAPKWAEAVGQSLHYSIETGKKPAIILVLESKKQWLYYNRLKKICQEHGITLWYVVAPDFK